MSKVMVSFPEELLAAAIARSEARFGNAGTFEAADLVRRDRDSRRMTRLLIDTSVLIKWFLSDGESELEQARALRSAHVSGEFDAHMLDLASYEVGTYSPGRCAGRVPTSPINWRIFTLYWVRLWS